MLDLFTYLLIVSLIFFFFVFFNIYIYIENSMELTIFPYLFILFYFILFYSYIARSLPLIFILVFIVSQGSLGCLLTLTKTRALKEGKQNIFGGKMRSTWLHKN